MQTRLFLANKKDLSILMSRGRSAHLRKPPPPRDLLALSFADRLPFLLKGLRPLEQGRGLDLAALGFDRLLGHELRPGEQRLLRLRDLVAVAVPVDLDGCVSVAVGVVAGVQDELDRRPDAVSVVAVPVDLDGLRLDFGELCSFFATSFKASAWRVFL